VRSWLRDAVIFATAFYAVEMLGSLVLALWLGTGTEVFRLLRTRLLLLLVGYAVLGAVVGAALGAAARVARSSRRVPTLARYAAIALTFAALALWWNAESTLPRRSYLLFDAFTFGAVCVALAVVVLARFIGRRWRGLDTRRFPYKKLVTRSVMLALAAIAGAAAFRALRAPAPAPLPVTGIVSTPGRLPDVLIIILDTVRADHVSAYGYHRPTTPSIDRLAAEGALFSRASSTATWTVPAHASLFTGHYPSTHGTDAERMQLPRESVTLAELAAARGYRTALFTANFWVTSITGLDRGFEHVEFAGARALTSGSFMALAAERALALAGADDTDAGAAMVTRHALEWIAQTGRDRRPFFAVVNYMEAHEPYGTVPRSHYARFLESSIPRTASRIWVRNTPAYFCASCAEGDSTDGLVCRGGRWQPTPQRAADAARLYDAGLRYVDDQVGRLSAALDAAGRRDGTLVIVTADHGESLGDHGRIGHGGFLTEPVLHVPLIARFPRAFAGGTRVEQPVSLVDVYPTVREAMGEARAATETGTSLFDRQALERRPVRIIAEYAPLPAHVWQAAGRKLECDYRLAARRAASLRDARFKYVWSSDGGRELYDLASDPGETANVAEQQQDVSARMHADLAARLRAFEALAASGQRREVDPATRDLLRSLGYVR
jgi:arylsulfatase A-like enzyme